MNTYSRLHLYLTQEGGAGLIRTVNTYSRLHLYLTQEGGARLIQFSSPFKILQSKCAFIILQMLLWFDLFAVW